MGQARTLGHMMLRARQLADMVEVEGVEPFVSDSELKDIINEQCRGLYDLLVGARGQEYYATTKSDSTVASQSDYKLPEDFYQLLTAYLVHGTKVHQMSTWEPGELGAMERLEATGGYNLYTVRYRLMGGNIVLRPYPTAVFTLKYVYVPSMPDLANEDIEVGDRFDGINGWETWAELGAAIEMLQKEESNEQAAVLFGKQQQVEQRIRTLAPSRDASRPPRIVDTKRDWAGSEYEFGYDDYDFQA